MRVPVAAPRGKVLTSGPHICEAHLISLGEFALHTLQQRLQSYNEERLENAKRLLQTTDRFFGFAAGSDWLMNFLRMHVLPPIAEHIFSLEAVRRYAFPTISQIGINYRHSSLSNHAGDENFEVKAGDRMPYFLIDGKNIFDRLKEAKFHFLAFSAQPAEVELPKASGLGDKIRSFPDVIGEIG